MHDIDCIWINVTCQKKQMENGTEYEVCDQMSMLCFLLIHHAIYKWYCTITGDVI